MSTPADKLRLVPDRWYGWQMVPGYFGERNLPYFSPIWMLGVTPRKTGRSIVTLEYINALYAEGVKGFILDFRILKHESDYLAAELLDEHLRPTDRTVVISHIEFGWIERFCPELWNNHPPASFGPTAEGSVSYYLKAVYPDSA